MSSTQKSSSHPGHDWRSLYPFRSQHIHLGGVRYHYVDEGAGQPLLLVHGNPTWSFYWRNVIAGCRDRFRVVVPDHVGCGLSDKPRDYPYRLAQHAANLRQLVHELDLREITLVAHDWGGAIGLSVAVEEPQRFSRLVLLNTAAFRAPRIPWRIRICRVPGLGRVLVQGLNGFARAALRMAMARPEQLSAAARAGLLAPYDNWQNREAIYRFVQDIPMHASHPSYADLVRLEDALPALAAKPALLVWGMRDWCFTPWFLTRFQDFFPQAEVERIDDAGHYVVEDAPERVVQRLRAFLESTAAPERQRASVETQR